MKRFNPIYQHARGEYEWEKEEKMEDKCEAHLKRIKFQASELIDAKYRRGVAEHGGRLWEKPGLMPNLLDEATDLVVYLLTLREQMDRLSVPEDSGLAFEPGNPGPDTCPTCGSYLIRQVWSTNIDQPIPYKIKEQDDTEGEERTSKTPEATS